jgi:hypothetical protein
VNRIISLGHPFSGLSGVEGLLQASGVQAALPSKREGLRPQDITDTLCQAHGCAPLEQAMTEADLAPLQAGAVWHGLALDLLLGNLQQPLWGWADARSIYWLDYWAGLDPHLTFVMVYNHPANALQASASALLQGQHGSPPDMALQNLLENWQAYNGAMLQFYSRHPGRCLLVNSAQAREQLADYLQQLGTQLHTPSPLALDLQPSLQSAVAVAQADPEDQANTLALAIEQGGGPQQLLKQWFGTDNLLEQHLLEQLLQDHPQALQIFQELQAAATVRSHQQQSTHAVNPAQAWVQLIEQRNAMAALTRNLYEQLLEQQQRYVSTQNQLGLETRQAQQTQRQLESAQEKINSTEEESALLLTQLHQVQEELERVFLKQQDSEQKGQHAQRQASALQAEKAQLAQALEAKAVEAKALLAEKATLSQALTEAQKVSALPPAQLKDLEEENDLLLTQLHQVQEELERYYLENQQLKSGKAPAQKQRLYGAEHRVKQHLSYRLGATMIAHSRSLGGWLRLPFLLRQEAKAYKRDQRGKVPQSLPPLHTYADAYEGERCKQHLSYRLGQTLLKHIKTPWGWMWLPFALVGTVRGFRKARV